MCFPRAFLFFLTPKSCVIRDKAPSRPPPGSRGSGQAGALLPIPPISSPRCLRWEERLLLTVPLTPGGRAPSGSGLHGQKQRAHLSQAWCPHAALTSLRRHPPRLPRPRAQPLTEFSRAVLTMGEFHPPKTRPGCPQLPAMRDIPVSAGC